ncbi:hypothetical protein JXB28_02830 [Candidatus Woesearchaeota archaeon]|nr:hypothetical protein [Candidatus Woesearchaeota archaeon]
MNVKEISKYYQPIDYSKWDSSGKGKNILPKLEDTIYSIKEMDEKNPFEGELWRAALPFQDKRDDKGHAEITAYFGLRLLRFHPEATREIMMPSIILHDIGWSQLAEEERALFADYKIRKIYEPILRDRHQVLGRELAEKILKSLDYAGRINEAGWNGEKYQNHILEIISQHDTRPGFFSLSDFGVNDGLMRDADKLWRVTYIGMMTEVERSKMSDKPKTLEEEAEKTTKSFQKPGFLYSPISAEMARIELENALSYHKVKR